MRHSQRVALAAAVAMLVAIALAAPVAAADPDVIVVAPGENLTVIAARHRTSVAELVTLNRLADPNRIYAGQRLRVRAAGGPTQVRAPAAPAGSVYVVKPGDTLWGIGQRTGLSVSALAAANRLANPRLIFVGQRLSIPGAAPQGTTAPSPAKPSPAATARAAAPPAPPAPPAPAVRRHRVAAGESLWAIARRYGTTVSALAAANSIANPSLVFVGQQLVVPGGEPAAGASTVRLPSEMARLVAARAGIGRIIVEEAKRFGVPPALALAVAWHESGWQADVVSSADAVGVMQLLPTTGAWMADMLGSPVQLTDPRSNVRAGVRLLRHYLDRYDGDRDLVLAAYYQGQGAVDRHGIYRVSRPYIASIRVLEGLFAGWAG